ncbi:trehalose-phosphatase [Leifsonia sp. LS-T14]|uniref:trehalose-phosphatase n=1 Tax=unclassified Leifsonia TaxID=2663824 RepID=UPI0035A72483
MTDTASHLPPASAVALASALQRLATADRLLLALDFDGTLAPFVDVPRGARALPESKAALDRLERLPNTWVAYVSGRPLSSLETVTEADRDALLVGSHGVEIRFGRDGVSLDLSEDERRTLERLGEALQALVDSVPETKLETKPVGFGVHYRLVGDRGPEVVARAREAAAAVSDTLTIRDGKDIIEFSVREAHKGDGVERLREYTKATAVLFAGDDVTDEDGFSVLRPERGDVGIKVGTGETAAQYRVADERAIATLLGLLAQAREAHLKSSTA